MPRTRKARNPDSLQVAAVLFVVLVIFLPAEGKVALVLVCLAGALAYVVRHRRAMARLQLAGIGEIDRMDGKAFEQRLWLLFKNRGYGVQSTPYTGDYGADHIITKHGVRTVVQAKRYSKSVGLEAVQQIVASKATYDCTEALVVTNADFTKAAYELARVNNVQLWERGRLVEELVKSQKTN
jgi:restriction system protein